MSAQPKKSRGPGGLFGVHRVLQPEGALPQAAAVLDATTPIYDNEALIRVETLNIDSASFAQMRSVAQENSSAEEEQATAIAEALMANILKRGKQVNPVTGSGGMLIGEIVALGPDFQSPCTLKRGERVATLVSLTLTPLILSKIKKVHLQGAREAQVDVDGEAILFSGAPVAKIPSDISQNLALSVLDVCGAPAQVERLVQPGQTVVILGAGGKSGMLSLHQARKKLGVTGKLLAIDFAESSLKALEELALADQIAKGDAKRPLAIYKTVADWTQGQLADLVINTTNVAFTEMACILSTRPGGRVYFFNMATDFSRAALGAEGVGRDVELIIGNGFTPGHAELSLNILRENPTLRKILSESAH